MSEKPSSNWIWNNNNVEIEKGKFGGSWSNYGSVDEEKLTLDIYRKNKEKQVKNWSVTTKLIEPVKEKEN